MRALLLLLSLAFPLSAQDEPLTSGRPAPPEQEAYDVLSYRIAVKVLPEERAILGDVTVQAELVADTEALILDLDDRFEVTGVGLVGVEGEVELPFRHAKGEVEVDVKEAFGVAGIAVGDDFLVRVLYRGEPRVAPRPPWDGGFQWEETPSGAPWIATSNQMQGADLWWPCKDQPNDEADRVVLEVTVPEGLVCATNGRQVDSRTEDGWTTSTWRVTTPINSYGIALNVAPYETITAEVESVAGDTFPVTYWVLPENKEKGEELFQDVLRQIAFMEETFGPYPFRGDKYGFAETPHLGMEHQSIIAYGNNYRGNPWGENQGFDVLHLHEFAHEWFANLVTCRNWKDFWIHESFATYTEALYSEVVSGPEGYHLRMSEIHSFGNRAPIAPREPMDTAAVYFGKQGGDIYYKGAWVLHTLRWLVRDDAFFPALRRVTYPDPTLEAATDGSACRFEDTEGVRAILEEHTGHELDWFFEVYLRRAALPRLVSTREADGLRLAWETPDDLPFPMPVEVLVDGESRRVELPEGEAFLPLEASQEAVVDPQHWLLREEER